MDSKLTGFLDEHFHAWTPFDGLGSVELGGDESIFCFPESHDSESLWKRIASAIRKISREKPNPVMLMEGVPVGVKLPPMPVKATKSVPIRRIGADCRVGLTAGATAEQVGAYYDKRRRFGSWSRVRIREAMATLEKDLKTIQTADPQVKLFNDGNVKALQFVDKIRAEQVSATLEAVKLFERLKKKPSGSECLESRGGPGTALHQSNAALLYEIAGRPARETLILNWGASHFLDASRGFWKGMDLIDRKWVVLVPKIMVPTFFDLFRFELPSDSESRIVYYARAGLEHDRYGKLSVCSAKGHKPLPPIEISHRMASLLPKLYQDVIEWPASTPSIRVDARHLKVGGYEFNPELNLIIEGGACHQRSATQLCRTFAGVFGFTSWLEVQAEFACHYDIKLDRETYFDKVRRACVITAGKARLVVNRKGPIHVIAADLPYMFRKHQIQELEATNGRPLVFEGLPTSVIHSESRLHALLLYLRSKCFEGDECALDVDTDLALSVGAPDKVCLDTLDGGKITLSLRKPSAERPIRLFAPEFQQHMSEFGIERIACLPGRYLILEGLPAEVVSMEIGPLLWKTIKQTLEFDCPTGRALDIQLSRLQMKKGPNGTIVIANPNEDGIVLELV